MEPDAEIALRREAWSTPFPAVVSALVEALGLSYVASVASVVETRSVREWAEGTLTPRGDTEERLRLALWLLRGLQRINAHPKAWFTLPDPRLDGASPGSLLQKGDLDVVGPLLLAAMQAEVDAGDVVPFDPTRKRR